MPRTAYAEITEGQRIFGTEVRAIKVGDTYYVSRRHPGGGLSVLVGTVTKRTSYVTSQEWRVEVTDHPEVTGHPTLGVALDVLAKIAVADYRDEVLSEEAAAKASPPADEVTTSCSDCGAEVPTIATGHGYPDLPRCPQATSVYTGMKGHRVSRDALDAAMRLKEVQGYLATMTQPEPEPEPQPEPAPDPARCPTRPDGHHLWSGFGPDAVCYLPDGCQRQRRDLTPTPDEPRLLCISGQWYVYLAGPFGTREQAEQRLLAGAS